jgi:starch synthase
MNIAFATSEAYPFAKTGGLADDSYSLPRALARRGHTVAVILPRYYSVDKGKFGLEHVPPPLRVPLGPGEKWAAVFSSGHIPGVTTYFIEHDIYFGRDGLYDDGYEAYPDNAERFAFFGRAVLEGLKGLGFKPDIIHCNDWQTALVPVYRKTLYADDPFFRASATVLTVHNAGYQGVFPGDSLSWTQLGPDVFDMDGLEFFGQVNYLKGGVLFADAVTTVSRRHAEELQTREFGYDIAGVFQKRRERLFGITNGVDYENWDPARDVNLPAAYSIGDLGGKGICKNALQERMGIEPDPRTPLLGSVSRMTYQKGMDVLAETLEHLLPDEDFQIAVLGSGDDSIIARFERLRKMFPSRVGLYWGYDERLAHLMEAGLDVYLMPSRYEPCGLNQMYSMKYGTIPLVRATGGLDDTVREWDGSAGTGFKFALLGPEELYNKLRYVIRKYRDRAEWRALQANAMSYRHSWDDAAAEYERVYDLLRKERAASK